MRPRSAERFKAMDETRKTAIETNISPSIAVFDIGNVLIHWDLRRLYRRIFDDISKDRIFSDASIPQRLDSRTAVWLYFRFPLRFRFVEEMLLERGIVAYHDINWSWAVKLVADHGRHLEREAAGWKRANIHAS